MATIYNLLMLMLVCKNVFVIYRKKCMADPENEFLLTQKTD